MNYFNLTVTALADAYSAILIMDLLRYLIGAGGIYLSINLLLRKKLHYRKIRPDSPSRRQMLTEFTVSLRTVAIFAFVGLTIGLADQYGLLRLYSDPARYGWVWFALSVATLVVLHDTWFYWIHRLMHRPSLFRVMHLRHHRSHNPSPFAAYSFNVGEAVLTAAYFPIVLSILPVSELAAFIFTAHMMLINALHHCGFEVYPKNRFGRPLLDWLTTTTHHDLHHARGGSNFGFYFTFWDRLMGTEHPDYHKKFAEAIRFRTALPIQTKHPKKSCRLSRVSATLFLCISLAVAIHSPPTDAAVNDLKIISGQWVSEGYSVVVKIAPCRDSAMELCGALQWAWNPEKMAENAWKRQMLKGFKFSNGAWRAGQLVHPMSNRIYSGTIRLLSNDRLQLNGCIARLICEKQIWRRLNSLPHINDSQKVRKQ